MATQSFPGREVIRFRKTDDSKPAAPKNQWRHQGLLQDQIRRSAKAPWTPSLSIAFRMLVLVRMAGAMYSIISDCDETFNYWEPLHFLTHGTGFQTWEYSPLYAIRSYTYLLLHYPLPALTKALHFDKRAAFFSVRIALAFISSFIEAKFYRTVVERVNDRVGRYLLFALLGSAGMWISTTAFLPSTFAMHLTTLALSFAFIPASQAGSRRTLLATVLFAVNFFVGWPFALALALPFVVEELFVYAGDKVKREEVGWWQRQRWSRFLTAVGTAALVFIPVFLIDSLFYGKPTLVPFNIISYNLLSSTTSANLYGTSPPHFYLLNLTLNFNVLLPLAIVSLPALAVTYRYDRKRLGAITPGPDQSSPYTLLALRLAPLYIWLGIISAQAHKEERFAFPAYPLLCFNAAVTLFLVRGWIEVIYIKRTSSSYQASKTSLFRLFTLSVVMFSLVLSAQRILALGKYYHAPLDILFYFQKIELPALLERSGLLVEPVSAPSPQSAHDDQPADVDLSPLVGRGVRLCYGKEWHRFPSSYLVPEGVDIAWIKSEFNGILPAHWGKVQESESLWNREAIRTPPPDMNDENREEPSRYVNPSTCTYLIDLHFPDAPTPLPPHEPDYGSQPEWEIVHAYPFLDAARSNVATRALWVPGETWQLGNKWGEYRLLRRVGKDKI